MNVINYEGSSAALFFINNNTLPPDGSFLGFGFITGAESQQIERGLKKGERKKLPFRGEITSRIDKNASGAKVEIAVPCIHQVPPPSPDGRKTKVQQLLVIYCVIN